MIEIRKGDARERLAEIPVGSVSLCVTSPPYFGLRSYLPAEHPDKAREIGLEGSVEEHIAALVEVFEGVKKALHPEALMVVNYGDAYVAQPCGSLGKNRGDGAFERKHRRMVTSDGNPGAVKSAFEGIPAKNLLGLPFRLAFALQQAGWWWRSCLPWLKAASMPESVTDRPGTSVEYVLLFSRSARYFWDGEAIRRRTSGSNGVRPEGRIETHQPHSPTRGYGSYRVAYDNPNGRNFRNSDLFFDTLAAAERAAYEEWRYLRRLKERGGLMSDEEGDPLALVVNPQAMKEPHYASYPPALIAPLIRAGSSEEGVCGACAAPWRRVVEKERVPRPTSGPERGGRAVSYVDKGLHGSGGTLDVPTITRSHTTGWKPSCSCDAEKLPALILDPFAGAGTTCKVAAKLGRRAIGIELSEEYCQIARRRLSQPSLGL